MDRARIIELWRMIPPVKRRRIRGKELPDKLSHLAGRDRTGWLFDPAFGWNFVSLMHFAGADLPPTVTEPWLRLGYDFLNGYYSEAVAEAKSWTHESAAYVRGAVETCLLDINASVERAARFAGLPEDSVGAYEQLWFNVVDRKQDTVYLSRIVYPEGRIGEFSKDYVFRENPVTIAMRGGYNCGMGDGMYFLGMREARPAMRSPMREFEEAVGRDAAWLARNGLAGQDLQVVQIAKALSTSSRIGGQSDDGPVDSGPAMLGEQLIQNMLKSKRKEQMSAIRKRNERAAGPEPGPMD